MKSFALRWSWIYFCFWSTCERLLLNVWGTYRYYSEAAIRRCSSKFACVGTCNFIKKRLQHGCFPVKFVKFLRTSFFHRRPAVAASYNCCVDIGINLFLSISSEGMIIWDKELKSGTSKICGRQSLRNLKGYSLLKQSITLQNF